MGMRFHLDLSEMRLLLSFSPEWNHGSVHFPKFLLAFFPLSDNRTAWLISIKNISVSFQRTQSKCKGRAVMSACSFNLSLDTPELHWIKKKKGNKRCQGCGDIRTLIQCWWEYKIVQLLQKTVLAVLQKVKERHYIIQQFHCYIKKEKYISFWNFI